MPEWISNIPELSYKEQYSHLDRDKRFNHNKTIIKYLKLDNGKPKHILDVGSGTGDLSRQLLNLGHSVVSVNHSEGWSNQFNHADVETKYNNVKIQEYWFVPQLSKYQIFDGIIPKKTSSRELQKLKSYSNKKYDYVICKQFAMHTHEMVLTKDENGPKMTKEDHLEHWAKDLNSTSTNESGVTPTITEDEIFQIFKEFVDQMRQVCKPNAEIYMGFSPPFSTYNGYGSKKLLKYSLPDWENVSRLGSKVLQFTI